MFNSEAWYGVKQTEVDALEKIDEAYLRSLFKAHSKTPIEAFYLETGKYPLRYILKSRRLMYWWHMERLNGEKMLYKFLKAQQNNPVKNDWILQVMKDKEELQIDISDKELLKMSKNVYKKYIRKKIKNAALCYLNMLKGKHNKMKNLNSKTLKCSEYLTNSKFTKLEAQMLFKFRTRMFNVKENFENLYQNMRCDLCHVENGSQPHLFKCPIIKSFVP